ncbi:lysozyme inhibitor LprI family protein [uncultured Sphingomonas sp.]|uniref:lysozyme inhibitor LprI family protein n=1 Tax=uncultured Sphingomonas sp. TaxID=158754 RepID=UPI003448CF69
MLASDCGDQQTTFAINECLKQELERKDAELSATYRRAVASAKRNDLTIDRRLDKRPGYYETILKAERAWIVFRDAHCAEMGNRMRGGTGEGTSILACLLDQTETRIKQLRGN